MVELIGRGIVEDFIKKHPNSKPSLDRWVRLIEGSSFKSYLEFKKLFGQKVDKVGKKFVFDISGNNYRLIAVIVIRDQHLFVTDVLTHSEYDKGKWKG